MGVSQLICQLSPREAAKMMAITPRETKQLDELESAFLESYEAYPSPRQATQAPMLTSTAAKRPQANFSAWISMIKERMMMKFVCCAPPSSILEDDDFDEILAKVDIPEKPRTSRKDILYRHNSASITPIGWTVSGAQPAIAATTIEPNATRQTALMDITHVLLEGQPRPADGTNGLVSNPITISLPHQDVHSRLIPIWHIVYFATMLRRKIIAHRQLRAAHILQRRWRSRTQTQLVILHEPEIEPTPPQYSTTTRTRRRRQPRKIRAGRTKTTCTEGDSNRTMATSPVPARKRSRSVEKSLALDDIERDVHAYFGPEEIDDEIWSCSPSDARGLSDHHLPRDNCYDIAISRCGSVAPPATVCRPRPVKSTTLVRSQAACTIQRWWRANEGKNNQGFEHFTQSLMPTIRSEMIHLRKRLEMLRVRRTSCSSDEDDFDWL